MTDSFEEWRIKYLDYKTGKEKVKAVARAISRANGTSRMLNRDSLFSRPHKDSPLRRTQNRNDDPEPAEPLHRSPAPIRVDSRPDSEESSGDQKITTPMLVPSKRGTKREPSMQYGSFVPTPPLSSILAQVPAQLFELPGPALTSDFDSSVAPDEIQPGGSESDTKIDPSHSLQRRTSLSTSDSAYEVGKTTSRSQHSHRNPVAKRNTQPSSLPPSMPGETSRPSPRALMQRLLSNARIPNASPQSLDINLPAFDQVRARQKGFFEWMDKELEKIENFYKSKEEEAEGKLRILREQLHEMRNRRIDELAEARRAQGVRRDDEHAVQDAVEGKKHASNNGRNRPGTREQLHAWIEPIERVIENAISGKGPRPGKNSQALQNMRTTPETLSQNAQQYHRRIDDGQDYVRRPNQEHEVPYRSAKRKLKAALKEYYRGLELLKSYALLNRTAFRKINKKYDKAVNARPPLRYMSEKVNKAWFVQSNVLESYIHAVEDLYARYFERGNHKVAVGKLRSSSGKPGEFTGSALRSGLFVGTGAVLAIQGLIYATNILFYNPDQAIRTQTSYLLQIYGGYFLALYLFIWFCLDCSIWARNKINYVFIFEFDPRNHLDWRQLIEFPAFLLLLFGLFIWLNFSRYGAPQMFIYYPVVLIFISVFVIFLPAPVLCHRSRRWFIYSHVSILLIFPI
jgi:xenotropic and polytropic retrovirus receptor 1